MKKKILQESLLYILIIIFFIALSTIYFYPILEGKQLPQMDLTHSIGMSKELIDFEAKNSGEYSAWTNSMFGGMPAYQIKGGPSYNIYVHIQRFLRLGLPYTTISILFIYLLGFFVLLNALKFDKWTSFVGALAFAFASYNLIIIIAGHITKTYAIAYMAPVVAGVILTFEKKYWLGGIITTIALGLQISTNHVQITYYLGLMLLVYLIIKFIQAIKEKAFKQFGIAMGILSIAFILAIVPNITNLWTTYEYGKYSNRGESEITVPKDAASSGLDKHYALDWSYGIGETFTLMIPNIKGGASGYIGNSPSAMEKVDQQFKENVANWDQYWGDQPFTSGPVYVGAIICFLFILGLFIVKGQIKWWLLAATILSIVLAWGKNFEFVTDLFFYYFPMYNKFRTVSMILVIAGFTIPLLAMFTLKEIIEKPEILKIKRKEFLISLGLTAGLALIFLIIPSFFKFTNAQEIAQLDAQSKQHPEIASIIPNFIKNIELARISIFKADVLRSFIFILLGAATLFLYSIKLFKKHVLLIILGILILADLWIVDRRYLNSEHFQPKTNTNKEFVKAPVDEFILKDNDPNYRVLNLNNPFNDGITPYFHKSIGGYHGAKLRRYQDIIDKYLYPSVKMIIMTLQDSTESQKINSLISKLSILNMLNTKYIIYDRKSLPIINMHSYGNAWYVSNYSIADNPDKEIVLLGNVNPRLTAVIDKRFSNYVANLQSSSVLDSGKIELTSYKPNHLIYKTQTDKEQLAVFSEIYYDKGWNAYIDNKPVDHIRVNYVLRALKVPAGIHRIEFKFEPTSYQVGQGIALSSSILIALLILGICGKSCIDFYKKNKKFLTETTENSEIKQKNKK